MDDNDKIFFDSKIPLILDKEIDSNSNIPLILNKEIDSTPNINNQILKIKDLIKIKYLPIKKITPSEVKTYLDDNFTLIKNKTKAINNYINDKTLLINNSIKNQENELKLLYKEKKLLDQNKIQSDIINKQQILKDN